MGKHSKGGDKPLPYKEIRRGGVIPMRANLNEKHTGEETFLILRHIAWSVEPEPVTVAVIGVVIIVDERKIHEL